MRARDLLKWKRALNEIKFKHSELELIKEICRTHGVEFHMFMEEYCEQNGINLGKLNQEKSVREAPKQSKSSKPIEKSNKGHPREKWLFHRTISQRTHHQSKTDIRQKRPLTTTI
jgi:hypothetical protein